MLGFTGLATVFSIHIVTGVPIIFASACTEVRVN